MRGYESSFAGALMIDRNPSTRVPTILFGHDNPMNALHDFG
jgi:hypothetical protein